MRDLTVICRKARRLTRLLYTMSKFSDRDVCAPDFMDRYLDTCRTAAPLVQFLTGLAW